MKERLCNAMKISPSQYQVNEAWVICRLHSIETTDDSADIYVLVDVASSYAFGQLLVLGEKPSIKEVKALFKKARKAGKGWPKKLIAPKLDPALEHFESQAKAAGFLLEVLPAPYLDDIVKPIQEGLDSFLSSRSGSAPPRTPDFEDPRSMLPDSYDPCSCSSGKKYKFCCKPIFREIVESMCAVEEGRIEEALEWIERAKSKVGETAEILSRYAIIYSDESDSKFHEYIRRALEENPKHPRSHYLLGLDHASHERLDEAIESYKHAIEYYPKTDKYHLNETWNNLANVCFRDGRVREAKDAWEKALLYFPNDPLTQDNLRRFIYENEDIPEDLRKESPFISRSLKGRSDIF